MIRIAFSLAILLISLSTSYGQDNSRSCVEHHLDSKILGKRIPISVYLPTGYDNLDEAYQCHYIFDGNLIGKAYSGLLDYFSQLGEMPEGIVIGMGHNRKFEINRYSEFIKRELIPFVDSTYRTNSYRLLAGHSSAGYHTSQLYSDSTELFDSYIIGSPVEISLLVDYAKNMEVYLYIAYAENDFPNIVDKCKKLQTDFKDAYNGELVRIDMISNKDHFSSFPSVIENSFEFIYQNWKLEIPQETDISYQEIIDEHYKKLSNKFGYTIIVQEKELYRLSYGLLKENKTKKANELLIYATGLYPNSAFIKHLLAKSFVELGDVEKAKLEYVKSLEIYPDNKQAKMEYDKLIND